MAVIKFPGFPVNIPASELIYGTDSDFIINAYLALQHQWPDQGGYAHYLYLLSQNPGHRLKVLKEIASSDVARYSGTKLEQDLPDNHLWAKSLNDPQRYLHTSHGLRVAKILSDLLSLRSLIGNLSLGKLGEALNTVVDTQQAHLSALESRLADNTGLVQALEAQLMALGGAAVPPTADASSTAQAGDNAWVHGALQRLTQRLGHIEQQAQEIKDLRQQLDDTRAELAALKAHTHGQIKREVAEYVNAMLAASRAPEPTLNAASAAPAAAQGQPEV
ncbi:MAG: hypothetical protein U5L74_02840 [Ideonella sp.]|nr:hypothetical protein [Ideonella sp.]